MDIISIELKIPKKFLKPTGRPDQFISIVHKGWIKSLYKEGILADFKECEHLEEWPLKNEDIGKAWSKIFICIYRKKCATVIPLPRPHSTSNQTETNNDLTFLQLLHYVMQTNHRNLWKEAYKKYTISPANTRDNYITLTEYNAILREILIRTYGVPIINLNEPQQTQNLQHSRHYECHTNLMQVLCCLESTTAFYTLHVPYVEYTLQDCLTYSPAILESSYTKPLFIIFQLLQILRSMHDRGLTIGEITLSDIYIDQNLWIQLIPRLDSNLIVRNDSTTKPALHVNRTNSSTSRVSRHQLRLVSECSKDIHNYENARCIYCGVRCYDKVQVNLSNANLEQLCKLWVSGEISNFTYLLMLNKLSGRRYGEPNCHYVMPWVTDFTSRCGHNWRDLTKSKFRLNKGDRQLDLTYEGNLTAGHQVPHHVSDVLSSITYYVYMARRTPKSVLCKNVRTIWVPAEYPSSIQRLQAWTPDECIPEFFTKPAVFKSIHEDLPDLEVPPWSSSPEDFIEKHREALESAYVSERLNHWIDLTFGYKLSGLAAVKAKNLILQLVDNHQTVSNSGVVQLFFFPHPPRHTVSSPWLGRLPPKIHFVTSKPKKRDLSSSRSIDQPRQNDDEDFSSTAEEDASSPQQNNRPLTLTRFLSRSRNSLNEDSKSETNQVSQIKTSPKSQKAPTFLSHIQPSTNQQLLDVDKKTTFQSYLSSSSSQKVLPTQKSNSTTGTIYLPKEYNPVASLIAVETFHNFLSKTFHQKTKDESNLQKTKEEHSNLHDYSEEHLNNAFINRIFTENYEENYEEIYETYKLNHKQAVATRRLRELQVLGCLIVEIFMSKQLRALGLIVQLDFQARLRASLNILKSCKEILPSCIKYPVKLLLQIDQIPESEYFEYFRYPTVTENGLPPPSAHQLLQPLLATSIFQFSSNFWPIYRFLQILQQFSYLANEHEISTYFSCSGGENCIKYENLERHRVTILRNMNECQVKICANQLETLLQKINNVDIDLILSRVIEIIDDVLTTGVLAAWYLFDPIARAIGPYRTNERLLAPILKIYESDIDNEKMIKLYHHSFLLRLIVRFGLKNFLEHFITPLVEAVGGYRDFENVDIPLHSHIINRPTVIRKASNLKYVEDDTNDILSPLDEDSTAESEKISNHSDPAEPEMFSFDKEDKISPSEDRIYTIINQILESDDIETGVEVDDEKDETNRTCAMSPTIPIPASNARSSELLTINCEVGSKKSTNTEFDRSFETKCQSKISDVSSDSVIWLSHRLGPVLTSKYLSRNLLRMLTLCYLGKDNQLPQLSDEELHDSVLNERITGDANALRVLDCLISIAALYGEQLIILQYLPHITELIILCKRRLTSNLEGGLISCIVLLKHLIPYLSDETLCNNLYDNILKSILVPSVRLVGTTRSTFPNGAVARSALVRKLFDTLYLIMRRSVMCGIAQDLFTPALQRLFLIFDKASGNSGNQLYEDSESSKKSIVEESANVMEESNYLEVRRDGSMAEWTIKDGRAQRVGPDAAYSESWSPPISVGGQVQQTNENSQNKALSELKQVFTCELAYNIYVPLVKYLGESHLELALRNNLVIKNLCYAYEQEISLTNFSSNEKTKCCVSDTIGATSSGIFGSNVSMTGNRIEVIDNCDQYKNSHFLSHKMENNASRHLRGNWLAYWEHEIGRADKDLKFNFKQIKLQTFQGHVGSVRTIYVLDNENSFMSGSRDKTIKLWSLRSQGDGSAVSAPQWTYTGHKKSVLSITFLESLRLAVSCDSTVHVWDPFMGVTISVLETSVRNTPVNLLKAMPAPNSTLLAATTDGTIRLIDARLCTYGQEYKVSPGPGSIIRCMALSPNGNLLGIGHSTGNLSLLDLRSGGKLLASWRAHEGELLQLVAPDSQSLISSSLDQTVSLWNLSDGKFKYHLKGATEPVHCLCSYNNVELISGTTANRIGVYTTNNTTTSTDEKITFSSNRLRSETFKGVLTSMSVLPLNKLLLLGSDTGNISLLC